MRRAGVARLLTLARLKAPARTVLDYFVIPAVSGCEVH
jgi:hypothetical protein